MGLSSLEFDFQQFANILNESRRLSKEREYKCCIPNCTKKALVHSHIVPQSVLKKYICNEQHQLMQYQIDEVHPMSIAKTGEIPFEKFATIGVCNAMSMPIFCKEHDNNLFCKYESDADSAEPYDIRFQVLQALRSIGALRYRESRHIEQNTAKASLNDFYSGLIYLEELQMCRNLIRRYNSTILNLFSTAENGDFSKYEFACIELEPLKLAICDAFIDDDDLTEHIMNNEYNVPVKALYINLIPKANHSYLFMGYDKTNVSDNQIKLMTKWKSSLKKGLDFKTLYNILCHCSNNWCISPCCDNRIIEYLKNNYTNDRMDVLMKYSAHP